MCIKRTVTRCAWKVDVSSCRQRKLPSVNQCCACKSVVPFLDLWLSAVKAATIFFTLQTIQAFPFHFVPRRDELAQRFRITALDFQQVSSEGGEKIWQDGGHRTTQLNGKEWNGSKMTKKHDKIQWIKQWNSILRTVFVSFLNQAETKETKKLLCYWGKNTFTLHCGFRSLFVILHVYEGSFYSFAFSFLHFFFFLNIFLVFCDA